MPEEHEIEEWRKELDIVEASLKSLKSLRLAVGRVSGVNLKLLLNIHSDGEGFQPEVVAKPEINGSQVQCSKKTESLMDANIFFDHLKDKYELEELDAFDYDGSFGFHSEIREILTDD